MDFSLGDDRQALVNSLSRYLADQAGWEARGAALKTPEGFSRGLWRGLAELGAIGALFGEAVGGYGGTAEDAAAVFGEIGRALVPGPLLATLAAGHVLEAAGESDVLAGVIAGDSIVSFAHQPAEDANGRALPDVRAAAADGGWRLTGAKGVVPYAASADLLVVTADTQQGSAIFAVARGADGLAIRDYPLADGGSAGELTLSDTPARMVNLDAGAASVVETALALAQVALVWEAVAVMDVLRDSTVEYLRTRRQFGIPIGKFQALQHRMATVALEIEQARSSAINAAARFAEGRLTRERAVAAAMFTVARAGKLVAEEAIQLHGGIGMTWELPLSHYAKRLTMIGQQMGDEDQHLARFMALGEV